MASDKTLHVMRDHEAHGVPMLGGMWGCKRGGLPDIADIIRTWGDYDSHRVDQTFLANTVYPLLKDSCMVHDSRKTGQEPDRRPFPKTEYAGFVGEQIPVSPRIIYTSTEAALPQADTKEEAPVVIKEAPVYQMEAPAKRVKRFRLVRRGKARPNK